MAIIYSEASDLELWQYCQANDMRAYNELFDRYAPKLFRQAARYINNTMDVEELVMDLLHKLWQKRAELQPENMGGYLRSAVRNRVINYMEKNIPLVEPIDLVHEDEFADKRQADYAMISNDLEAIYQAKLSKLSPQRRKVFRLCREEDMSHADIAKTLNLSVNTVENHMSLALSSLRDSMKEYSILALALLASVLFK